eukprot:TRINITY_DN2254_c0_g1_i2.p1 TRINITY_DN2254_c0_g1~~TRINITY_DN2254_c0_g1_i2.p1  ORF type:complete len:3562 (+),score=437.62 TRINITY_DN2254_c0_g1_i2:2957-13642(+)
MAENDEKFFETLVSAMSYIDTSEMDVEGQKPAEDSIIPKDWTPIISLLNTKLAGCLKDLESRSFELSPEISSKVGLILDFAEKFFRATRRRTHSVFLDEIVNVLKLDDWGMIVKALKIMCDYATRNRKGRKTCTAIQDKIVSQWLLNLALGQNLKNSRKMGFLEMLLGPPQEVVFQYFSVGEEAEGPSSPKKNASAVPSIRTVRLSHLAGNKTPSYLLAQELAKKCELPSKLFPALWSKVRIAKSAPENDAERYRIVLASLLAYNVFCIIYQSSKNNKIVNEISDEAEIKTFIGETELKARLINDVTQLLKYTGTKPELHVTAINVLTALIETEGNFRKSMGETGTELGDDILRQLGVNVTHTGLLHTILRECTSLQVVKDSMADLYKVVVPSGSLEILAATTASSQEFLASLLHFLTAVYQNTDKEDLNNQEAGRFWTGVKTALINMLQIPTEDRCYVYQVPVVIAATKLLLLLSIKRSVVQDVTNVDAVILRLAFEIQHLEMKEGMLVYPVEESRPGLTFPKLEHRQELCRSLVTLLSSSINLNIPRNAPLFDMGDEMEDDFIRVHELRRRIRQNIEEVHAVRALRSRREELGRVIREQPMLRSMRHVAEPQVEEEEKEDEIPSGEAVAVSRRVLESKLIELFSEIFKNLAAGAKSRTTIAYEPIVYSALWLISSIIRDIPTSVPSMVLRGVVPGILRYIDKSMTPGSNYFYMILATLNAFTLHEEGTAQVASHKVMGKVFYTLVKQGYEKYVFQRGAGMGRDECMDECARQLLSLYSQAAPSIKTEMVQGLKSLLKQLGAGKIGKDTLKKNCKFYSKSMQNVLGLFHHLVQNVGSRDHAKFLSSINERNEVLRTVLNISRLETVLRGAKAAEDYWLHDDSYASHIMKFYLGDIGRMESYGEAPENVVADTLLGSVKTMSSLLDIKNDRGIPLGDFATGKRAMGSTADEIIAAFPEEQKLSVVLSTVEWICKSVKLFGRVFPRGSDSVLGFIGAFHSLLIKELIRLYSQRDHKKPEEIKQFLSKMCEDVKDSTDDICSSKLSTFLTENAGSHYERTISNLYKKVRTALPDLIKSSFRRVRRYEMDPRTAQAEILRSIGRCAGKLVGEAFGNPEVTLMGLAANKEDSEKRVLHNILLVKDASKIMLGEYVSLIQVFEFNKTGGFDQLHGIYQQTVNLIIDLRSTGTVFLESLKLLLTYLMKLYATIMSPSQLKMLSSKMVPFTGQSELTAQGFKTTEDFIASVLAYVVEGMLFQTKYKEYKTAVRFLAECAPHAFMILLNVIRKYPNRNTLTQLFQESGPESNYEDYLERRRRREREQQPVPPTMVEQLLLMGFDPAESEDALRRNDLNVDNAITDMITRREEAMKYQETALNAPALLSGKSGMRKLEAKTLQKEIEGWLDYLLASLYEGLYSISTYKYKYLLYSISEFQSLSRPYKIRNAFALLLNELQTLLFSLELTYEFTLIPNEEFPVTELAEASITDKLKKKIEKYTKTEGGVTEEKLIVLHKMSTLIDVITTFLRLSKTNELLKIMCENKIAQCLIVVLSKLVEKELVLPGRKLLPKVLVLLGMIYKEVHQTFQGELLEQRMKLLMAEGPAAPVQTDTKVHAMDLLPNADDTNRLIQLLCALLNMDPDVTSILRSVKMPSQDKPVKNTVLVTTEVLTATLLLVSHITKDYGNVSIVLKSGLIGKILELKQVEGSRDAVPSGLFVELVFNLFESPEILGKYMERVITSVLFAKTQWREKGRVMPKDEAEVAALQRASAIDMDRFLGSIGFLMARNAYAFFESCKKVALLQQELQKDAGGKSVIKYSIALNKDSVLKMVKEGSVEVPNVKVMDKKELKLTKEENEYVTLLEKGVKENLEVIQKTNADVLLQITSRLIQAHFEDKNSNNHVVNETLLLDVVGQLIKTYPETLALLLTYRDSPNPSVTGNSLISFLFSALFPQKYLSANSRLQQNDEWKNKVIALVKYMTYSNIHLHHLRHHILLTEIRKRVVAEIFRMLAKDAPTKLPDPLALAKAYSTSTILEGLLLSGENSVMFPRENQYTILKEMLKQKREILKACTGIARRCNLHSEQAELVTNSIVNVMERVTRFNKVVGSAEVPMSEKKAEEEEIVCVLELYAEEYKEGAEPMEINVEEEEEKVEEDEYVGEEEIKLPQEENLRPDSHLLQPQREFVPRYAEREYSLGGESEEEDDFGEEFSAMDFLRRHINDGLVEDDFRRVRQRPRPRARGNRNELESVQVQINSEPLDKGKSRDVRSGLHDIYERESAENTNAQITKIIKGDVLGEEAHPVGENVDREIELREMELHMGYHFSPWRMRIGEAEEEAKQEELPAISLFGYVMDKQKISELLKNQLIGTLETQVVHPEEVKKEEPKKEEVKKEEAKKEEVRKEEIKEGEEPVSSLILQPVPESKQEEEKKSEPPAEVHKEEEKKAEQPAGTGEPSSMTPADLANLINSMMGSGNAPLPEEHKGEERKEEEHKQEEKKEEEKKLEADLTEALVAQRRRELSQLIPNLQIEDTNVLLQIDPEFLRALTPELRQQSVQQLLAQNRPRAQSPSRSPPRGPADMDPATFIATIADENLRDEILMSASPEFLAALPPDMSARAEHLRERNLFDRVAIRHGGRGEDQEEHKARRAGPTDPLEGLVMVPDKGDESEKDVAKAMFSQTSKIAEGALEALIRLLYVNTKSKVPLNSLFSNICTSKRHLYKVLNSLLFILSKHHIYEKLFQSKLASTTLSDCVSETKLVDSYFPPICLYRGMEFTHLTYSVVSLRIFSLLSSLLNKPHVTQYFFMPLTEVSTGNLTLKSVADLQSQIGVEHEAAKGRTPLTELLSLTGNPVYRTSEKHLEAIINFINDLFNTSEYLTKQKKEEKVVSLPVISVENVKQMCQIFYFEGMSDSACNKLAEILMKLSQVEENAYAIMGELDNLLELIGVAAIKEWGREIRQLDPTAILAGTKEPERQEDTQTEIKLGRIFRLMKRIYDGHRIRSEDESPSRAIRLYVTEGDAIEEALPSPKSLLPPQTEAEARSFKIRSSLMNMLRKEALTEAFSVLTDLVAIISKKSLGENSSRKSQLLLKLVPSIESLIMAYDYHFRDPVEAAELLGQVKQIREAKPEVREAVGAKFKRAYVFYKFLDRNHKAFNNLIRQMSQQTFQTVIKPFILRFPSLLDFENKRSYFRHEQKRIRGHSGMATLRISVTRDSIFTDSYNQMSNIPVDEIKGRLRVNFKDEQAADAGGVTREWYTTLSRAMFNPIIGLFKKSAHGNTYQPDPKSVIEPNHLNYFKFIGRIIGKALLDGQYLECYFTRALYKTLVGQPLTIQDMQDYDPELYKSLLWIRDNDVTDLDCNFTYTIDYFGRLETKDLIEDGKNVKVTNENKQLFIVKMCKAMLQDVIRPQIEALQKGLYEIIPKSLVSIFDSREIELLISGLPDVDILDLKKNTDYHGYNENSKVVQWLWELLETFSTKERAEFLQFVTGTSKVPLDGFKNLPGASGIQKFQIHKVYGDAERLPTAHTWQDCQRITQIQFQSAGFTGVPKQGDSTRKTIEGYTGRRGVPRASLI